VILVDCSNTDVVRINDTVQHAGTVVPLVDVYSSVAAHTSGDAGESIHEVKSVEIQCC
jgi:hypothetical protein